MKYKHIITIHLPQGRASFAEYEDQTKINLAHDVIESEPHNDGSCIVLFSTIDPLLRFRLEKEIPGTTVFPHHFSNKPLEKKHIDVLAQYGVKQGDIMEDALHKISIAHGHYRFHPHVLS